jgi:hypothetical protein
MHSKAATPGLVKTLHLPSYGFNLAAAIFYIFYALFEVSEIRRLIILNRSSRNLGDVMHLMANLDSILNTV